jgi:hypothetical protein
MPQKTFNREDLNGKWCRPFVDAMTYGVLMSPAMDFKVQDGQQPPNAHTAQAAKLAAALA